MPANAQTPAFRRRILIVPSPGVVVAELEDDWHRMVVTIRHADGVATAVVGEMKRWPWTTCRGAIERLTETFGSQPLVDFARRGEKSTNCTHLHDLAVFATAHAHDKAAVAYDVTVTDPVEGRREARLIRDGAPLMAWSLEGWTIRAPAELAGRTLNDLGSWIAGLDRAEQEAARVLRWAAILAHGRDIAMPAGMSATAFPGGSCYTFQPAVAAEALRRADVDIDFSAVTRTGPLADRAAHFTALVGEPT